MGNIFRERLKNLRLKAGKTQDDMARLLNINRSTYGEYERGKIMPPVDKIEQIANILNVRPYYLIGWDTPEAEENTDESALADKIKKLREEKNKTLVEMALEIGMTPDMLSDYETGMRKIPFTAVKKLAKYFGVDITLLYGFEFGSGTGEKEELKENVRRLKTAETWNREIGKAMFTDEELAELINYAKYILSKRKK